MVGLVALDDLADVPLWREAAAGVRQRHPDIRRAQFQPAVVRALINWQVSDLLDCTRQNLRSERIHRVDDVRGCRRLLVEHSPEVRALRSGLEAFLQEHVYRHCRVVRMALKGQRLLRQLFAEYCRHPAAMPHRYCQRAQTSGVEQTVCDYLAGMTDRYAQEEYLRLFQPNTAV